MSTAVSARAGSGLSSSSRAPPASAALGSVARPSAGCRRQHGARQSPVFRSRGAAMVAVQALPPNPILGAAAAAAFASQTMTAPSLTEPPPPPPAGEGGNFALAQRLRQLQELQQQAQAQTQQQTQLADTAPAVMASARDPGSSLRSAPAATAAADGGSGSGVVGAADGGATPSFCEPETLSGLMRQFVERQESFDSGLQMDGLLAYYRRLGCSAAQVQAAVVEVAPAAAGAEAGLSAEVLTQQLQLAAWELVAAAVAAAALAAYQSRPRGWSRKDLLEVRASAVAGQGLFTTAPIPSGTVLGAYPGRLRSGAEMLTKCEYAPLASSYAFRTGDGSFLDPTDVTGQPSPYPAPGLFWPLPSDVSLCFANEPPKGSLGTNASVEDGSAAGDLLFVACRDIPAGAEIFIDYGITYDRSNYGKN
ncbi:hypothetical protein HXX76_008563 [Chlamydomonas incerta]|uniref:SET domain-containing protein n=1 Tax=Chlamydomonas incerta TaxID=51695 RepID=A0A835T2V5_CHLIN|nr:hypothetical protein HXX76_008563 [Chlamydomonas incerta]|eukprot:KAG2432829.1 hypothetical protein HXX76_008563 [Chlamydomonas incerta]